MGACVATPATSSSVSLGYAQWSYATPTPAPVLTGYYVESTYRENYCASASLRSIRTYKLNECNIDLNGDSFSRTYTEIPYVNASLIKTLTSYSDLSCKTVDGSPSIAESTLNVCVPPAAGRFQKTFSTVLSSPFQLTSGLPMVKIRYFG